MKFELYSLMRLRYLQSGGNNPEILLHIASMEQDAIALAQNSGNINARHQKNIGNLFICSLWRTFSCISN